MNKTCGNCRSFDEEACLCGVHFDHFSEAYPDTEACELFEDRGLNMDKGGFITNRSDRVFRVMGYLDSYASTEQAEHAKAVYARIKESDYPEGYAIVALLHDSLEDGYATKRELIDWLDVSETELVALDLLTRHADQDYVEYIHALKRNDIARAVKYADLYVNIKRCIDDLDNCYSLAGRYIGAWSILKHYEHKLNKCK